ncbi:MAG: DUF2461 domain-containing protein [Deltaproteobacteria bacterium]|nr:DUF2461 domain-containing protein [Deltaproteobacteria bacterium]
MFPKKTFTFLEELAENNNRQWFQENKKRYEVSWLPGTDSNRRQGG